MMGEIYEIEGKLNEDCGLTPRIFEYLFKRIMAVTNLISDLFQFLNKLFELDLPSYLFKFRGLTIVDSRRKKTEEMNI